MSSAIKALPCLATTNSMPWRWYAHKLSRIASGSILHTSLRDPIIFPFSLSAL
jgi:hypothetical protein